MASQPDAGAVADGQPVTRLAGPDVADHEHWFHALWFSLGPYGPQDVHYHPCCEGAAGECWAVIFGSGRDCGGREAPHERMVLTEDGPQPAEALARLRGTAATKPCGCGPVQPCDGHLDRSPLPPDPADLLARAEAAEAKLATIAEHRNAACAALRIAETQARYPAGDEATAERYRAAREALEGTDGKEAGRG